MNMYCVCAYTDTKDRSILLGFVDAGIVGFTPYDNDIPVIRYMKLTQFCFCEMEYSVACILAAFLNAFWCKRTDNYYFKVVMKEYIYKNIGEIEHTIDLY